MAVKYRTVWLVFPHGRLCSFLPYPGKIGLDSGKKSFYNNIIIRSPMNEASTFRRFFIWKLKLKDCSK